MKPDSSKKPDLFAAANAEFQLGIFGASARAAAQSAERAAIRVVTADLFADADLQEFAVTTQIHPDEYPSGGVEWIAGTCQPSGWMYVGGLENWPEILAAMSEKSRLLGCDADTVRSVRSPELLSYQLAAGGFPTAQVISAEQRVPRTECGGARWLIKPLQSCGGRNIQTADDEQRVPAGMFGQEFVAGVACSGQFLTTGDNAYERSPRQTHLLGVTRPFPPTGINASVLNEQPHAYCGSVGPVPLNSQQQSQWQRLGEFIASKFELTGLFGIDAIESASGELVVLEVNPRYTASMELLDAAFDTSLVAAHIAACTNRNATPWLANLLGTSVAWNKPPGFHAKLILYAEREIAADELRMLMRELLESAAASRRTPAEAPQGDRIKFRVADVPTEGTSISRQHPICTLLASGETEETVIAELTKRAESIALAAGGK